MDAAARVLLRTLSSIPLGYLLIKKGVDCLRRKRNASFQLQAISGEAAGGTVKREIFFAGKTSWAVDSRTGLPARKKNRLTIERSKQAEGLTIWRPGEREAELIRSNPGYPHQIELEKIITPGSEDIGMEWYRPGEQDKLSASNWIHSLSSRSVVLLYLPFSASSGTVECS